ncbi:MAG: methionyl-tRNA formyltransferase [Planctomycetota bacterium]
MRVTFLGAGAFGIPTLRALHKHHDVLGVVTQPDKPAGRKRKLTPTPIAQEAEALGLTATRSADVNTPECVAQLRAWDARAAVVIAFGQKLSDEVIAAAGRDLAVNLHASLLPKYRGAAPIQRAVMEGERDTGVAVIGLAQRMDAGPVYASAATPVGPLETAGELHDRLAQLGPDAVLRVLDQLDRGALSPAEQDESLATKAPKLKKTDGTVSFDQPADDVRARVHGLTPWPGCRVSWFSKDLDRRELILRRVEAASPASGAVAPVIAPSNAKPGEVLPASADAASGAVHVACAPGVLRLLEVQAPGSGPMPVAQFVAGKPIRPGDRFEALSPASGP